MSQEEVPDRIDNPIAGTGAAILSEENKARIYDRSAAELELLKDSMEFAEGSDIARMPESMFKELFVPFFATGVNEKYPQVSLQIWMNFAQGANRPVKIIADHLVNGKEVVLYEVPPYVNRSVINPVVDRSVMPIDQVVSNYNLRSKFSPADAEAYFQSELTQRALFMRVPGQAFKDVQFWNDLFVKYGYPAILPKRAESKTEGKNDGPIEEDLQNL